MYIYMEQILINIYENYLKTKYDKNDINIKIFNNNDFLLFWYNNIYIIELNSTMFKIKTLILIEHINIMVIKNNI